MSKLPQKSQFLIYKAENGAIKIDVRFEDETVWLTQQLMAELFQSSKQNIGKHLKNILKYGPDCEVLAPKALRTRAEQSLEKALQAYRQGRKTGASRRGAVLAQHQGNSCDHF